MAAKFTPVTHVIFDIDGTLLDTEKIYEQTFQKVAMKYGYNEYPTHVREAVLGRREIDSAQIVVTELNMKVDPREFLYVAREMQEPLFRNCEFLPGARELVEHLHENNIPIAMASSSSYRSINIKFSKHQDVYKLFSHVVSGSTDPGVKQSKPSPEIFLVCANRFQDKPSPENCLVIEDSPSGVQAAVSAGMQVVAIPDPLVESKLKDSATLVLKSLLDFKPEEFGLPPYN